MVNSEKIKTYVFLGSGIEELYDSKPYHGREDIIIIRPKPGESFTDAAKK